MQALLKTFEHREQEKLTTGLNFRDL